MILTSRPFFWLPSGTSTPAATPGPGPPSGNGCVVLKPISEPLKPSSLESGSTSTQPSGSGTITWVGGAYQGSPGFGGVGNPGVSPEPWTATVCDWNELVAFVEKGSVP